MHVTDVACEALSQMLIRRGAVEQCLRLSTFQGNYRFILDEPIEQDLTFSFEERTVLVISETISRDLWGITVDCVEEAGKRKLIFRKAANGEPLDAVHEKPDRAPMEWKAQEHERLLAEIAEIGQRIAALRGGSKTTLREQLQVLEAAKQEKWDAIRALWAGDGGWHKRVAALQAKAAAE
ncbi:MAG: hypothetical protein WEC75_13095 [Dehalococcoidia bacterium]